MMAAKMNFPDLQTAAHIDILLGIDNERSSAQRYAEWLLLDIDVFWQRDLLSSMLEYTELPLRLPRQCIKVLRVLHEITTHCTKVDVLRLALTTNLLLCLKILLTVNHRRGNTIIREVLAVFSNLIICGWRVRDTFVQLGIVDYLLDLLHPRCHQQQVGQVLWLLFQVLKYKLPGPDLLIIKKMSEAMPSMLHFSQDVTILLPTLQLTRLLTEYYTALEPGIMEPSLLRRVVRFVVSPNPRIQREAIFVLSNMCQKPRVDAQYRFPRSILQCLHSLVLGGATKDIRVLVLQLLGTIIDNRCISPKYFITIGLMDKIVWCVRYETNDISLAASWTLASLSMFIGPEHLSYFVHIGGLHALCALICRNSTPVQLLRNGLIVLVRMLHCVSHGKDNLVGVLGDCEIWPYLEAFQAHPNVVLRTLSQHLTFHHARILCWGGSHANESLNSSLSLTAFAHLQHNNNNNNNNNNNINHSSSKASLKQSAMPFNDSAAVLNLSKCSGLNLNHEDYFYCVKRELDLSTGGAGGSSSASSTGAPPAQPLPAHQQQHLTHAQSQSHNDSRLSSTRHSDSGMTAHQQSYDDMDVSSPHSADDEDDVDAGGNASDEVEELEAIDADFPYPLILDSNSPRSVCNGSTIGGATGDVLPRKRHRKLDENGVAVGGDAIDADDYEDQMLQQHRHLRQQQNAAAAAVGGLDLPPPQTVREVLNSKFCGFISAKLNSMEDSEADNLMNRILLLLVQMQQCDTTK